MYEIVFRTRFERSFKKLDKKVQSKILDSIDTLIDTPFDHPHIRKIAGVRQHAYRLRVGKWRVLYLAIQKDNVIEIIDLFLKKSESDYRKHL